MLQKETIAEIVRKALAGRAGKGLIVAGNWKMNLTLRQALAYLEELRYEAEPGRVMLFPSAIMLAGLASGLQKRGIRFGPQNIYHKPSGAFTGETAIPMAQEIGCDCALVGHSERRQYFGETDRDVNRKAAALLDAGMTPVICIGESLEHRKADRWRSVLEDQVRGALEGLSPERIGKVIFAYEPVWAIGTSLTATPDEIGKAHTQIRQVTQDRFGAQAPILYGGSVNAENAVEIGGVEHVSGFLIGGASLDPAVFSRIIRDTAN